VDTAVIGFVGVIAGAATTGAVQFAGESLSRRNDSQAAARLLYGALVEVDQELESYLERGSVPAAASFGRQIAMWETQRDKLARVLDVLDFQLVQAAFSNVQRIVDVIESAREAGRADGGVATLRADPHYEARIAAIRSAELIALGAGRRIRDRLKSRQKLERLANSPAAADPAK
jgi:hypothetical protein